jgi:EpsD family peptidyl-prolyl cis-trans isomerase
MVTTRWSALAALTAAVLLGGCSDKNDKANAIAARVDKEEITLRQVNAVLQQQRNLRPEQTDVVGRQVLERLIDQQLALRKAEELGLDRIARVQQQIEAARREIVARAYVDKVGEAAPRPTAEEIKKYYDDKPALFSERRIYNIQEIAIEARPDQAALLREQLGAAKNISEFVEFLKANDFRFAGNQAVRAAEQLPLNSLDTFAKMKDGQAMLVPTAAGMQVIVLAGSRSQPVTEEQARPAIEQFILAERRRKLVDDEMKSLRVSAKVEYLGKFAESAASAPAAGGSAASAASPAPAASGP